MAEATDALADFASARPEEADERILRAIGSGEVVPDLRGTPDAAYWALRVTEVR